MPNFETFKGKKTQSKSTTLPQEIDSQQKEAVASAPDVWTCRDAINEVRVYGNLGCGKYSGSSTETAEV